jgi:iron complex transport system ATP-binding protein
MNDDKMCIGTPRELSANDTLGNYIERDNIEFDKKNMIVKIKS